MDYEISKISADDYNSVFKISLVVALFISSVFLVVLLITRESFYLFPLGIFVLNSIIMIYVIDSDLKLKVVWYVCQPFAYFVALIYISFMTLIGKNPEIDPDDVLK